MLAGLGVLAAVLILVFAPRHEVAGELRGAKKNECFGTACHPSRTRCGLRQDRQADHPLLGPSVPSEPRSPPGYTGLELEASSLNGLDCLPSCVSGLGVPRQGDPL